MHKFLPTVSWNPKTLQSDLKIAKPPEIPCVYMANEAKFLKRQRRKEGAKKKEKEIHANPEIQQLKPGLGTHLPLSDPNPFHPAAWNRAQSRYPLSFARLSPKHTRSP
jgi:hypothetical protein